MRALSIFLILSFAASAERAYKLQPDREKILSPAITEASGLAVSPTNKDFLWVVNDSGGTPEIHLSRTNGTQHGAVIISGARNIDWEDLASFQLNGKSYLLIADTGDNNAARQTSNLYIVREPEISAEGKIISGEIPIAWEIVFSYEGGPRDCEAVAVDPGSGKILLLSKRTEPPILYELPLRPESNAASIASRIGTTEVNAPIPSFIPYRNQPTGMDISADSSVAAVVTYYGVFLYARKPKQTWPEAFAAKPAKLGSHGLHQAEAIALSSDGDTIFVISEGPSSPITRFLRSD